MEKKPRESVFRYQDLSRQIEAKILDGTYPPGEKLPSLRELRQRLDLSIATVHHAYMELEAAGLIEARPRSGYYVAPVSLRGLKAPTPKKASLPPREIRLSFMINSVVAAINDPRLLPLGSTAISPDLLPYRNFSRILKTLSQREIRSMLNYSLSEGDARLRRLVSLRHLIALQGLSPEDVVITNGCTEAVALALLAVTRPGDTVAIEAPTNFSFLQLLQQLGLLVSEIPTDPRTGLDLGELEKAVSRSRIQAALFIPNFHNPLGALMPDEKKRALVRMLTRREIPIIEDDISSELHYEGPRPKPLKAFDEKDLVLTCSSFSKTLAPGLRIGWILPGRRFQEKIRGLKAGTTVSTSSLDQHLIAEFMETGAYDRHLRSLRAALKRQAIRTALAIQRYFPPDSRLAVPEGGSLLWVQMPDGIESTELYSRALDSGISIIPGTVCSNTGQFRNFIQLSCGAPVTAELEAGISTLGRLVAELASG